MGKTADTIKASPVTSNTDPILALDWEAVVEGLDTAGYGLIRNFLSPEHCNSLIALYSEEPLFRRRIVMQRYNYGRGEYQYFAYPLPRLVNTLRETLYPRLVPIANRWNEAMNIETRYPSRYASFLKRCHAAGQNKPTPLMLRYQEGDFNCLHQDLYGELKFPLQAAILLSRPGKDFSGGEFVITEQRPRKQSRAEVIPLTQGDAVIFAVSQRPVQGSRGYHRVNLRHGVSRLRGGNRYTLGIIFHDAQ